MKNLKLLSLCLALLLVRTTYADQRLVVFGDSLSDNGRLFAITKGYPPRPYGEAYNRLGRVVGYFPGRFTDGQNWVDYFPQIARFFGVGVPTVRPYIQGSLKDGDDTTNFAVGGATSGDFNLNNSAALTLPGFKAQIRTYLDAVNQHASANDLYVIWIGANDFAVANILPPQATVDNIQGGITALAEAGAKHIVVISVPDISLTPEVKALQEIAAAKQFVAAVNFLLAINVPAFAWRERIKVELVDINAIFVPIVCEPFFFGFSNSTGFVLDSTTRPVSNPNDYVFWDAFHPTTNVHRFAAGFIFKAVFSRDLFSDLLRIR